MPAPIRFAVLGAARIARTVAPHIRETEGAELTAVASRSADKAEAFAAEFRIPVTFNSYQAALDSPDIDAIYLPLPPALHREWTIRAAEAGKHILCEKPLAVAAAEVDEMQAACRQHNVVLLDGTMWYHTPRAAVIRQIVSQGQLGDIRQFTAAFTFRWDDWPLQNLRMQQESGGGSLLDLGWYCVGAALLVLDQLPTRVFATASWHNGVDTRLNGMLWFPDGLMATVESGFDTVRRRWLEIAGSRQALVCDDFTRQWADKPARFWIHNSDGVSDQQTISQPPQEQSMVQAFCELIRQQQVDHPWLELARRTQFICDKLAEAARTESIVEV